MLLVPPIPPTPNQDPAAWVYHLYEALAGTAPLDAQFGLGGSLLYAGEVIAGRNLLYAANIAGAASLAASADPAALRQAMREGVIDFLVTSLEEALRILKNEIRKRQAVSVGVSVAPHYLVEQMLARGVLPDLLPSISEQESDKIKPVHLKKFLIQGARPIAASQPASGQFVTWTVDRACARWLPRLDACALAVLPSEDRLRRRWLQLAPRYLGRLVQRHHGVVLTGQEKARFESGAAQLVETHNRESQEPITVTISDESA